jgi:hypothetical protein
VLLALVCVIGVGVYIFPPHVFYCYVCMFFYYLFPTLIYSCVLFRPLSLSLSLSRSLALCSPVLLVRDPAEGKMNVDETDA